MNSVADALEQVLAQTQPKPAKVVRFEDALGLVLAEDIASDIDSPPHDKSIVDGYAVVASDFAAPNPAGDRTLTVVEEVVAGKVPTRPVVSGHATRIMTGAPLPLGADAVVMVEETEVIAPDRVRFRAARVTLGQNIVRRAASMRAGERVLAAGCRLRPIEVGLLAEVGRSEVRVVPRPTVAILPTGDELVAASERPGPGQIRNSNGPMLAAQVVQAGATPLELGIARDRIEHLRERIARGLTADVLVLSGGVSAGILDLVPRVLAELGVRKVFHRVNLKPGKPLWFGTLPGDPRSTLVFGLPGNPVSSLVCFELFVRPALRKLAGLKEDCPAPKLAALTYEYVQRGDRPTYHPAVVASGSTATVTPLAWHGSGDLRTLADANCLAYFPAGKRSFAVGESIDIWTLD